MIPIAASAAIANDLETTGREQTANAFTCPWLEGYPDCHPDGGASRTLYSTTGESMAQKKSHPKFKGMRRDRKSDDAWVPIPAPM